MKINKYFRESEFACNINGGIPAPYIDYNLVAVLTDVRQFFGQPVIITSSFRTAEYNEAVGGTTKSHHLYLHNGAAADIKVKHVDPEIVYEYLDTKYHDMLGLGLYKGLKLVHVDMRTCKARW